MKQAIGYVRVSTEQQANEGVSLEAQKAKIAAWCAAHEYELVQVFVDAGISGKKMENRPELLKARAAVKKGMALVAYSLSRLARSTKDLIHISEEVAKKNGDLVSLSEQIDTTTAAGKMMFQMLAVLSEFERNLTRSGIHLFKFWFSVSRKEQERRFREREKHPLKQWKLSPIDKASLDKWDDYTSAKETMFFSTDTADAPWIVIKSDCKKRARLNAMRYVLHRLAYDQKDSERIGSIDPLIVGRANVVHEIGSDEGN